MRLQEKNKSMLKIKIAIARGKIIVSKLFLVALGVCIGGSGVFVSLTAPELLKSETVTFENTINVPIVKAEEVKAEEPETVEEIIRRVSKEKGFQYTDRLVKIAECESSFDPTAENPKSSAKGIFQILNMHGLTVLERFDPETATKWAIGEVEKNGFSAWNESKDCWK